MVLPKNFWKRVWRRAWDRVGRLVWEFPLICICDLVHVGDVVGDMLKTLLWFLQVTAPLLSYLHVALAPAGMNNYDATHGPATKLRRNLICTCDQPSQQPHIQLQQQICLHAPSFKDEFLLTLYMCKHTLYTWLLMSRLSPQVLQLVPLLINPLCADNMRTNVHVLTIMTTW